MTATISSVSTESVDRRDRLELWETYNSRELVGLRCSTYEPEGLRASEVNLDLGELRVASIDANAHVVDRSMQVAQNAPKDSVFMAILLEGSGFFHSASGSQNLRAGDALIYNAGGPHLFAFDTPMRQHMLDIPRHLVGAAPTHPILIHRGSGGVAASVQLLSDLVGGVLSSSVEPGTARGELLGLIHSLFKDTEPTTAALRRVAQSVIDAQLSDPGLTADAVARTVGVSLRHLNRGFASENTTVSRVYPRPSCGTRTTRVGDNHFPACSDC